MYFFAAVNIKSAGNNIFQLLKEAKYYDYSLPGLLGRTAGKRRLSNLLMILGQQNKFRRVFFSLLFSVYSPDPPSSPVVGSYAKAGLPTTIKQQRRRERTRRRRGIRRPMKKALDNIFGWANEWGLRKLTQKIKYGVFGYRKKKSAHNLSLFDATLERIEVFKFLGVWFDEKMTWHKHVHEISNSNRL